jgi:aspartate aminotransferase
MNFRLANRIAQIKPSTTLAIAAKAKELAAQGVDVIDFGGGEPDLDTPKPAKEAGIAAIQNGFTKYTQPSGTDELKEAILEKFMNDNKLRYEKNQILVSCGAKHSLYNINQVLLEHGDEAIIPAPYWVSYPDQVLLNDATPVIVETKEADGFLLTPEILAKRITSRTKVLILNSPANPTGSVYQRKHLEGIAETVLKHKLIVISDEIYEKFSYDGAQHTSFASLGKEIQERTIVVNGVSKSHAMTGWRIGYAAGPREIIAAMTSVQSQSTSNPNSIAQKAAVVALRNCEPQTQAMVKEFDRRRQSMVSLLNKIPDISCIRPSGAFYTFPKVSAYYGKKFQGKPVQNSNDLAAYLLNEAKVTVVPGEAFGNDKHLRLSYTLSVEKIEAGLKRIGEAFARLK